MRIVIGLSFALAGLVWALRATADRLESPALAAPDTVLIPAGFFEMGSDDDDVAFANSIA